jgi:hypothetical protein
MNNPLSPETVALMAEYDVLVDALFSKPYDARQAERLAVDAFNVAHPAIRDLVHATELPDSFVDHLVATHTSFATFADLVVAMEAGYVPSFGADAADICQLLTVRGWRFSVAS